MNKLFSTYLTIQFLGVQHFWPKPTLFWEAVCVDIFGILWNKMLILQAHSTLTDQPVQPVGVDFVSLKGLRSHRWWDQLGTNNCWWVFLKQKTCFKNQYILFGVTMSLTSGYIIWRAIGLMHYPQERDGVFKNTEQFLEISKPKLLQASSLECHLIQSVNYGRDTIDLQVQEHSAWGSTPSVSKSFGNSLESSPRYRLITN